MHIAQPVEIRNKNGTEVTRTEIEILQEWCELESNQTTLIGAGGRNTTGLGIKYGGNI